MRASFIFTLLSCIFALVAAAPSRGLNAQRLARGLPPLPPPHLQAPTPVAVAPRSGPSGTSQCSTGPVQCCNSVTKSNDSHAGFLAGLLGIVLPANTAVGLYCSPLSVIGVGGNSCSSQTVCCSNNQFNGLIAIGCTPISINL